MQRWRSEQVANVDLKSLPDDPEVVADPRE
jgi:hypothetical protein